VTQQTPKPANGDPDPDFDWSWTEEDGSGWVPPAVDTSKPSAARMYDYALGGKDNFAVDREAAERALQVMPDGPALALANRDFLVNSVRVMANAGIRQFIDLGTGIPTSPNVHETARDIIEDAAVVYVDNDPIVLAHSRATVDDRDRVRTIMRDIRDPASVLQDPILRRMVDLDQPVGLLMFAVLHFVDISIAPEVVRHYVDKLAPGSYVAFSVGTREGVPPEVTAHVEQVYQASQSAIVFRTRAQVEELVEGLDLLEPGIAEVTQWRADGVPGTMRMLAGVGIKR
jgi:hypothetical protein